MEPTARHDLYAAIHKGLRACMSHVLVRVGRLDAHDAAEVAEVGAELQMLLTVCRHHVEHEETMIHPALRERAPGCCDAIADDHVGHRQTIDALEARLAELPGRPDAVAALYRELGEFVAHNLEHMQREEREHNAALWATHTDEELLAIERRIVASLTPIEHEFGARWMLPHLTPAERARLVGAMRAEAPAAVFEGLLAGLRPLLGGRDWAKLARALGMPARPWPAEATAA